MAAGFISHVGRHVGGLANPPAAASPAGWRSFWGFWFGGMCSPSGVTPTPPPPPAVASGGWTHDPWARPRRRRRDEPDRPPPIVIVQTGIVPPKPAKMVQIKPADLSKRAARDSLGPDKGADWISSDDEDDFLLTS